MSGAAEDPGPEADSLRLPVKTGSLVDLAGRRVKEGTPVGPQLRKMMALVSAVVGATPAGTNQQFHPIRVWRLCNESGSRQSLMKNSQVLPFTVQENNELIVFWLASHSRQTLTVIMRNLGMKASSFPLKFLRLPSSRAKPGSHLWTEMEALSSRGGHLRGAVGREEGALLGPPTPSCFSRGNCISASEAEPPSS